MAAFVYAFVVWVADSVKSRRRQPVRASPAPRRLKRPPPVHLEVPPLHPAGTYDAATCSTFVSALGDGVLENSFKFFGALHIRGEIGSVMLAELIGVDSPRAISGVLTTPLKRRAKRLGLSYPWNEEKRDGRMVWATCDDRTELMFAAIRQERRRRSDSSPAG